MAKHNFIDIPGVASAGVEVKRWWKSAEVWNQIVGIVGTTVGVVAGLAPQVLPLLPTLGLSPVQLFVGVIVFNGAIQINAVLLKVRSTSVIGGKTDVAIAKDTTGN
jgi:hypothetical protein